MAPRNTPCGAPSCGGWGEEEARGFAPGKTVLTVAAHAYALTSVAQVRTSARPNIARALAARNARTMPDPQPTSTTSGEGEGVGVGVGVRGAKRVWRNAVSEGEESVSSTRKESSAGS